MDEGAAELKKMDREDYYLNIYLIDLGLDWDQLKGKRILDIGAGLGEFAALAKSKGVDVTSIDSHPEWHKGEVKKDAPYFVADALELPFSDESFDLVISHSAVYAIVESKPDVRRLISEAMRVLKENGEFRFGPKGLGEGIFTRDELFSKEEQRDMFDEVDLLDDEKHLDLFSERVNQRSLEFLQSINPTARMHLGNPLRGKDGVYFTIQKQTSSVTPINV